MSQDKPATGVSPLSIISLLLGFITGPGVFCCFGYGTGILGLVLGLVGFVTNASSANRIVAGFGVGINGLAMAGYAVLMMFTMATSDAFDPEVQAKRQQEMEDRQKTREADATKAREDAAAAEKAKWDSLPATERKFCEAVVAAAEAYSNADNDLKKSKVRRDRAAAIKAAVPGGTVAKWTGKVDSLTTTGDGNVVLVVRLPCDDFTVGTWNNELSDIMDNTLISASSSAYDTLAEMKVGSGITFGGRFIGDDVNGFKGTSMTEMGSMTGEAFLLRF